MATVVQLTPELERFARDCVEGGRYADLSDVVRSGLRLLQDAEAQRRRFQAMLDTAEAEADRDGDWSLDEVLAQADAIFSADRR